MQRLLVIQGSEFIEMNLDIKKQGFHEARGGDAANGALKRRWWKAALGVSSLAFALEQGE